MDNRTYLAIVRKGGLKNNAFRQLFCAIDPAGQVSFSHGQETFSEDAEGGGYIIHLQAGERFQIWMGNGNGNDCTIISFQDTAEAAAQLPTPVEILEAFHRWKVGPGVEETTRQAPGVFVREYRPTPAADPPADTGPEADTSTP